MSITFYTWTTGMRAELEERFAQQTPNLDGSCKTENCTGHLIKRVRSFFRGVYGFSIPECSVCGRSYLFADPNKAAPRGMREFTRKMQQAYY